MNSKFSIQRTFTKELVAPIRSNSLEQATRQFSRQLSLHLEIQSKEIQLQSLRIERRKRSIYQAKHGKESRLLQHFKNLSKEFDEHFSQAVIKIQAMFRGFSVRKTSIEEINKNHKAKIDRQIEELREVCEYCMFNVGETVKTSAVLIQKHIRSYKLRHEWNRIKLEAKERLKRQEQATEVIQTCTRKFLSIEILKHIKFLNHRQNFFEKVCLRKLKRHTFKVLKEVVEIYNLQKMALIAERRANFIMTPEDYAKKITEEPVASEEELPVIKSDTPKLIEIEPLDLEGEHEKSYTRVTNSTNYRASSAGIRRQIPEYSQELFLKKLEEEKPKLRIRKQKTRKTNFLSTTESWNEKGSSRPPSPNFELRRRWKLTWNFVKPTLSSLNSQYSHHYRVRCIKNCSQNTLKNSLL